MHPLLLAALASGLVIGGVRLYQRRAVLPSSLDNANALQLLNFTPFTLESGKSTTLVYLAPSGLTAAQAQAAIVGTVGAIDEVELTRRQVPIPAAIAGAPVLSADLWTMRCAKCGPPAGSPPTTFTPQFVLERILTRQAPTRAGIPSPQSPQLASPAAAAQALAGVLYTNAAAGAGAAQVPPEFIPIAGRQ